MCVATIYSCKTHVTSIRYMKLNISMKLNVLTQQSIKIPNNDHKSYSKAFAEYRQ